VVGAETGLVKTVQLHNQTWTNLGGKLTDVKKENEIRRMCWADDEENEILVGLRSNNIVKVVVPSQSSCPLYSGTNSQFAGGKFVGLERHGRQFVVAGQRGLVTLAGIDDLGVSLSYKVNLKPTQDLRRLRSRSVEGSLQLATGGLNHHLRLWDVNAVKTDDPSPLFTAKNVKNDWLNLQVRTCVQDIRFIPESHTIVTCTGYHQVRLYDPKAQRRPMIDFEVGVFPLTCLDVAPSNPNHVIVGNTRGMMTQHDLRVSGRMVHGFKGFAGGIRDIRIHPTEPLVASVGLDRFLRVHNIANHRLLNKVYLKSRLNQCLFRTTLNEGLTLGEEGRVEEEGKMGGEEGGEVDDVWDGMEMVGDKKGEDKEDDKDKNERNTAKRKATVTIEDSKDKRRKKMKI